MAQKDYTIKFTGDFSDIFKGADSARDRVVSIGKDDIIVRLDVEDGDQLKELQPFLDNLLKMDKDFKIEFNYDQLNAQLKDLKRQKDDLLELKGKFDLQRGNTGKFTDYLESEMDDIGRRLSEGIAPEKLLQRFVNLGNAMKSIEEKTGKSLMLTDKEQFEELSRFFKRVDGYPKEFKANFTQSIDESIERTNLLTNNLNAVKNVYENIGKMSGSNGTEGIKRTVDDYLRILQLASELKRIEVSPLPDDASSEQATKALYEYADAFDVCMEKIKQLQSTDMSNMTENQKQQIMDSIGLLRKWASEYSKAYDDINFDLIKDVDQDALSNRAIADLEVTSKIAAQAEAFQALGAEAADFEKRVKNGEAEYVKMAEIINTLTAQRKVASNPLAEMFPDIWKDIDPAKYSEHLKASQEQLEKYKSQWKDINEYEYAINNSRIVNGHKDESNAKRAEFLEEINKQYIQAGIAIEKLESEENRTDGLEKRLEMLKQYRDALGQGFGNAFDKELLDDKKLDKWLSKYTGKDRSSFDIIKNYTDWNAEPFSTLDYDDIQDKLHENGIKNPLSIFTNAERDEIQTEGLKLYIGLLEDLANAGKETTEQIEGLFHVMEHSQSKNGEWINKSLGFFTEDELTEFVKKYNGGDNGRWDAKRGYKSIDIMNRFGQVFTQNGVKDYELPRNMSYQDLSDADATQQKADANKEAAESAKEKADASRKAAEASEEETKADEKSAEAAKERADANRNAVSSSEKTQDTSGFERTKEILESIDTTLKGVLESLGRVDDESGFQSLIVSLRTVLELMTQISEKNFNLIFNEANKSSGINTALDNEINKIYERYQNAYEGIVENGKKYGMNSEDVLASIYGVDEKRTGYADISSFLERFSKTSLKSLDPKTYISTIQEFIKYVKLARQEMSETDGFYSDLQSMKLPTDDTREVNRRLASFVKEQQQMQAEDTIAGAISKAKKNREQEQYDDISEPLEKEAEALDHIAGAGKNAADAKMVVKTANEGLGSTASTSAEGLEKEAAALEHIALVGDLAASAKRAVKEANEGLGASAKEAAAGLSEEASALEKIAEVGEEAANAKKGVRDASEGSGATEKGTRRGPIIKANSDFSPTSTYLGKDAEGNDRYGYFNTDAINKINSQFDKQFAKQFDRVNKALLGRNEQFRQKFYEENYASLASMFEMPDQSDSSFIERLTEQVDSFVSELKVAENEYNSFTTEVQKKSDKAVSRFDKLSANKLASQYAGSELEGLRQFREQSYNPQDEASITRLNELMDQVDSKIEQGQRVAKQLEEAQKKQAKQREAEEREAARYAKAYEGTRTKNYDAQQEVRRFIQDREALSPQFRQNYLESNFPELKNLIENPNLDDLDYSKNISEYFANFKKEAKDAESVMQNIYKEYTKFAAGGDNGDAATLMPDEYIDALSMFDDIMKNPEKFSMERVLAILQEDNAKLKERVDERAKIFEEFNAAIARYNEMQAAGTLDEYQSISNVGDTLDLKQAFSRMVPTDLASINNLNAMLDKASAAVEESKKKAADEKQISGFREQLMQIESAVSQDSRLVDDFANRIGELKVQIESLSPDSFKEMEAALKALNKEVESSKSGYAKQDQNTAKSMEAQRDKIISNAGALFDNIIGDDKLTAKFGAEVEELHIQLQSLEMNPEAFDKAQADIDDLANKVKLFNDQISNQEVLGLQANKLSDQLEKRVLQTLGQGVRFTPEMEVDLEKARTIIKDIQNTDLGSEIDQKGYEKLVANLKEAKDIYEKLNQQASKLAREDQLNKLLKRAEKVQGSSKGSLNIDASALVDNIQKAITALRNLDNAGESINFDDLINKFDLRNVVDQITNLEARLEGLGKTNKFAEAINNQSAQFLATYFSFQDMVRYAKQITSTVTETNSALTELKKVSDASNERIQQSFRTSAETAQELGATITNVINSTADWARIGYNVDEAEQLAKTTTMFQVVGDNMTQETASEALVSTLKGYQMDADEALSIVDKFNEVLAARLCRNANKDRMRVEFINIFILKLLGHPKANLPIWRRKSEKSSWMLYGEIKAFERMSYVA